MALADVQPVYDDPHKGGGLLGSVVGGGVGAAVGAGVGIALAPFTGGSSLSLGLQGAATGLGVGMQGGGLIGEQVDPSTSGSTSDVSQHSQNSSPLQTMAVTSPEVQLAGLQNAKQALSQAAMPADQANHYLGMINSAQSQLKQRMGVR